MSVVGECERLSDIDLASLKVKLIFFAISYYAVENRSRLPAAA